MSKYMEMQQKQEQIVNYAFRLYARAGGSIETHYMGRDVHKIDNNTLLQKCFTKAERKYI